jgi:hypothetical protein
MHAPSTPLPALQYETAPFPHLRAARLLPDAEFAKICFPDVPVVPNVRSGRMIAIGEPLWDQVMDQPGWAELKRIFLSEAFVLGLVSRFAEDMRQRKCLVDAAKAYVEPWIEDNADSVRGSLDQDCDPNALFVRFDFQAGGGSYNKKIHCDLPRRVVGGVLFMTGAEQQGMEGGEFAMFRDLSFRNDRSCHAPKLERVYACEGNTGVFFLNGNDSFHGPLPISRIRGERQWIYYSISSRRDIWPRGI